MSSSQENLITILKKRVHKKLSFIDIVSSILQLNYDAAYRRVNNKTSLSIDETVILAKYFDVSLNRLYNVGDKSSISISQTSSINNEEDLELFFNTSFDNLHPLLKKESVNICYSAKDLPIFYLLNNSKLSKFKIYVWLNLLDTTFSISKLSFDKFNPSDSLLTAAQKFGSTYSQFNIKEIWNENVLNRTIKQIYHFFEIGLLSLDDALIICSELEEIVKKIEVNARAGKRLDTPKKTLFTLYHNEIMALSNTVIVNTPDSKKVFSPYLLLSYHIITDPETCNNFQDFFEKQLESSNLLSSSEEKGRSLFFNKLYKIINRLRTRLKIDDQLPLI
ncbi:MAG: hypothetical protein L3J45_05140 [Flavobacteriaceae bacterium]|nr:hypothetical protein [Flavobacteriaceae bacterium]